MSNVDAIIFTLAGCYMLIETLSNRLLFISVTIVIILVAVLILICVFYKNLWIQELILYSACKSLLLLKFNIHLLFCKRIIAIIVFKSSAMSNADSNFACLLLSTTMFTQYRYSYDCIKFVCFLCL